MPPRAADRGGTSSPAGHLLSRWRRSSRCAPRMPAGRRPTARFLPDTASQPTDRTLRRASYRNAKSMSATSVWATRAISARPDDTAGDTRPSHHARACRRRATSSPAHVRASSPARARIAQHQCLELGQRMTPLRPRLQDAFAERPRRRIGVAAQQQRKIGDAIPERVVRAAAGVQTPAPPASASTAPPRGFRCRPSTRIAARAGCSVVLSYQFSRCPR